jgi:hypothetical protein
MIRFPTRLLTFSLSLLVLISGLQGFASSADETPLIISRGRAVCLDEAGRPADQLFECNTRRYGFVDKDRKLYAFIKGDTASEVFNDSRVRRLELQISARLHSGDRLELIKFQSIREGKLYDLYYFCEICNIRAYAPGLCPCCRDELELRETPAT